MTTPKPMTFNLDNGADHIGIGCCDLGSYFRFDKPLSVVWADCEGSIAQYYALMPYDAAYRDALHTAFQTNLNRDFTDDPDGLLALLRPLLQLFQNGEYQLRFFSSREQQYLTYFVDLAGEPVRREYDWDILFPFVSELSNQALKRQEHAAFLVENEKTRQFYAADLLHYTTFHFYEGDGKYLIATQPRENMNPARVAHFEDLIQRGERPFALVLNGQTVHQMDGELRYEPCSANFILDGHHKLQAYKNLGINPAVAEISRLFANRDEATCNVEQLAEALYPW